LSVSYQFSFLKIVPVDAVQAGFAFSIGKNSKIRARRAEPRIHFKEGMMNECQAEALEQSVYGSLQRSLNFSDSFLIPKANPAWTLSTYPWFLEGLNC